MSDEEGSRASSDENEDDENESHESEHSQLSAGARIEEERIQREKNALADVAILADIFSYIDKTSRRISRSLLLEAELKAMKKAVTAGAETSETSIEQEAPTDNRKKDIKDARKMNGSEFEIEDKESEADSTSWSDYGDLDDAQRAHLLDKALLVLAGETSRPYNRVPQVTKEREPRRVAREDR